MTPPVWTKNFILLLVGTFLQGSAFYFLLPVLPLFVIGPVGGDEHQVGLVVGLFSVTSVIFRPLAGYLLDRHGRQGLLLLSAGMFSLAMFSYAWATVLWVLLVLRLAHGLVWGLSGVAASTVVADLVPPSRRGEGLGAYGLAMPLALAAGPMAGAFLLADAQFERLFIGSGVLAVLGLLAYSFVRPPLVQDSTVRLTWTGMIEGRVIRLFVFWLLPCLGYGALLAFSPLYALKVGFDSAGPLFSLYAVGALTTRPLAGRLYDKLGPLPVMEAGFLVLLVGWLFLGLSDGVAGVTVGAICLGMGVGASLPAFQTMAMDLVEPQRRGAANATILSAYDVGIALGAYGSGLIVPYTGLSSLFILAAALTGVGMLLFALWVYPHFVRNRIGGSEKEEGGQT